MITRLFLAALCFGFSASVVAAAPKEERAQSFAEAKAPVYSVKKTSEEMVVAVSPAGRNLRIAGISGTLLGAGIDAIANSRHRRAVEEVLQGYDAGEVFETRLRERLEMAAGAKLGRTAPLGSTAGYANRREAVQDRYRALGRNAKDVVLDLELSYGLFGYDGILVAKIDGEVVQIPNGKSLWEETIVVSTDPILGIDRLQDPTKRFTPDFSSPRLSATDDAISKWTGDGGATIRKRFEDAVDGAVSALLISLGLAEEPLGEYYLGRHWLNKKKFDRAEEHFRNALRLDAGNLDARNGLAVTLVHAGNVEQARENLRTLTQQAEDYAPGWYNLAWALAQKPQDLSAAKTAYQKALELGLPPDSRFEKQLGG